MKYLPLSIHGLSFIILFAISILLFRDSYNILIKKRGVILLHERMLLYILEKALGKTKFKKNFNSNIIRSEKWEGINFLISGFMILVMSILSLSVLLKNW